MHAASKTDTRSARIGPGEWTERITQALDYYQIQNRADAVEKLRNAIVERFYSDEILIDRLINESLQERDRKKLNDYWIQLGQKNACAFSKDTLDANEAVQIDATAPKTEEKAAICSYLVKVWTEHLSTLFFYEDSAPRLEEARRALLAKDCRKASEILRGLTAREGTMPQILAQQIAAADCQDDKASANKFRREQRKLPYTISE